jgi:hypothetical protein
MSTTVSLRVGAFEIHTGRNEWYEDLGDLFQPSDLVQVPDRSAQHVLRKPFADVRARLNLLGTSEQSVKTEFEKLAEEHSFFSGNDDGDNEREQLQFDVFRSLVNAIDTSRVDDAYIYEKYDGYSGFFEQELAPAASLSLTHQQAESAGELLTYLGGNSALWLLSQNEDNLRHDVIWDFAEHVAAGYSTTEEHIRPVRREHRFLIVTEGSSDSAVLEKAFRLGRSAVYDFFYFIDAEREKFPYPGHGGLKNFCRGLITINVLNQTVVLFDNDAAGLASFNEAAGMALPTNVRVLRLPDLPAGTLFSTIGPDGESEAEINGRAAAIETYLDLSVGPSPRIRWKHFEESIGEYHGALESKHLYAKVFRELGQLGSYDFKKLELVLNTITSACVRIAQARTSAAN